MKYEDLKCEFCDGNGETEKYVEPYGDSPVICTFCNGTGIDLDQIEKFKVSNTSLSNEEQKSQLHKHVVSGKQNDCPDCIAGRDPYDPDWKCKNHRVNHFACASGAVDKTVSGWPKLCKAESNKTCKYPSCYCPDITQGV